MVRPTLLVSKVPSITVNILTNYSFPILSIPVDPPIATQSLWNVDDWNVAIWSTASQAFKRWYGVIGGGESATVQMDFIALGGSKITAYDWWVTKGGPL